MADLGSLNGTLLNGEPISVGGRKRGRDYRLSADDILQVPLAVATWQLTVGSLWHRDRVDGNR